MDAKSVVESGVALLIKLNHYASIFVLEPVEVIRIDKATLNHVRDAQYRVTTVVPLVDSPYKNVRILTQEGLDELLDGYEEYGEFIIEISKLDSEQSVSPDDS